MPLKLTEPTPGRSPYWKIRGTYLGVRINQSTGSTDRRFAAQKMRQIKEQIERGQLRLVTGPTFADAMTTYLEAGGDPRFLAPLLKYWNKTPLENLVQSSVDACAAVLYPNGSPATRNRQVHTPILAIARHVGVLLNIKRPKGANGTRRACFLTDQQLFRLLDAAEKETPALGALFHVLAYCGPRLSEALSILCDDVDLTSRRAYIRDSKNGEPQMLHLPPPVVAALANLPLGLDRPGERVFRQWVKSGFLRKLMLKAYTASGVDPQGAPAHILRHTYASNMKRLGVDLMLTGRWKSRMASDGYVHISDEAQKADLLPVRKVK